MVEFFGLTRCQCTAVVAWCDSGPDATHVKCWNCGTEIQIGTRNDGRELVVEGERPSRILQDEVNPNACPF